MGDLCHHLKQLCSKYSLNKYLKVFNSDTRDPTVLFAKKSSQSIVLLLDLLKSCQLWRNPNYTYYIEKREYPFPLQGERLVSKN